MKRFCNPIISGFNPDPSICRVGEDYYLVTSSFEFSPGVPIYHSKNLVDWELISYCLADKEQLPLDGVQASRGIYAPTIRYHKGTFYMCTTNVGGGGNFYVTTQDIKGKWSNPIWVDMSGIDPTIVFDEGKAYFLTNQVNDDLSIGLAELDIETGKLLSEPKWISNGTGGRYVEAPHIFKLDDMYYLMLAEGGCGEGHMVTIHRSRHIFGPYESCPYNPVLTHRDNFQIKIQATGHADMVWDTNGNCWIVCLGVRNLPKAHLHNLGRETFLTPVRWENKWPIIGNGGTIELEMEGPIDELCTMEEYKYNGKGTEFTEKFENEELNLEWNWLRNKDVLAYQVIQGKLYLKNQGIMLSNDCKSPCFMGIRQKEFTMEFKAVFSPSKGCFGGITAYYNDGYHYDIFIQEENGQHFIGVRKTLFSEEIIINRNKIQAIDLLELIITSDEYYYYFYYCINNQNRILLGKGRTAGLCSEITHYTSFTGVFLGVFCDKSELIVNEVKYKGIV